MYEFHPEPAPYINYHPLIPRKHTYMEPKKMEIAHYHEQEKMKVLYEASYQGCVSILNTLIQQDPLILHRITSQTFFVETPLHISALLGHLEFAKVLLTHKPKLALELNSFQSTALHLASAEGHIDIVKELLLASDDACLVSDQQGRIPLHYAVMRGRLEVAIELIRAKPESLRIPHKGNTIFHLCVIYNHLKILKALVELDTDIYDLLSSRDLDGNNTILHLAVMLKHVEILRYLVSVPKMREVANLENDMGHMAHDIVKRIPQDFNSSEIEMIFMNTTWIKRDGKRRMENAQTPIITAAVVNEEAAAGGRPKRKRRTKKIFKSMGKWFKHNGNWLEEMRGNLSLVATVIATMTFQVAINPPGSFVQQDIAKFNSKRIGDTGPLGCYFREDDQGYLIDTACPGEAMLASRYPDVFLMFVIYNSISFVASLGVTLLLVSGVPLKNKVVMWLLCIGMCITLTFLTLTYFNGLLLTSSFTTWDKTQHLYLIAILTWVALLGVVGLYIIVGVVIWAVKKRVKRVKHYPMSSMCQRSTNGNDVIVV